MNAVVSTASTSPTQTLLVNASLVQQQQPQQPQQQQQHVVVPTGVPTIVQTVGGSGPAVGTVGGGGVATGGPATVITTTSLGLHDDVIHSPPSTPESEQFDDSDLLTNAAVANDEVTQRLMAAGTVGLAAAAAIATGKKRKRPHSFETDPSIRRRQQTRLLRELKATIDEYTTRIGQQAVVMIATPGKPTDNFKVFGAQPLENVMRDLLKTAVITELENALAAHAPPSTTGLNGTPGQIGTGTIATNGNTEGLHDLPPLVIDGIPTPVEKMTQAQLRCFIPLMLKYSTGRGKPGWGRESTRPPWWPQDLPWANVRSDVRSDEDKQRVSWTHALRQIVINCYRYHGREDLLPAFGETTPTQQPTVVHSAAEVDDDNKETVIRAIQTAAAAVNRTGGVVTQANQNTGHPPGAATAQIVATQGGQTLIQLSAESLANAAQTIYSSNGSIYGTTMVQAINNPDGSVSIIQMDPATTVVTLSDGTQAQLRTMSALPQATTGVSAVAVEGGQVLQVEEAGGAVVGGTTVEAVGGTTTTVEMAGSDAVATLESALSQGGQIILTGEDGSTSFPVGSMVAIPVSMYHHSGMQVMQTSAATTAGDGSPPAGHETSGDNEVELVTGPD